MSKQTAYEGLWKSKTSVWYISKGFSKKSLAEMPEKFRLIVRENKYHRNNDDGTPRFIFKFVNADVADELRYGIQPLDTKGINALLDKLDCEALDMEIGAWDAESSQYDRGYRAGMAYAIDKITQFVNGYTRENR